MALGKQVTWRGIDFKQAYFTIGREIKTSNRKSDSKTILNRKGVKTHSIRVEFDMYADEVAYLNGEPCIDTRAVMVVYETTDPNAVTPNDIYKFAVTQSIFDGCVVLD